MSQLTKRVELYKKLPLRTPFSIHIFPSYFCNFKCSYCLQSLSDLQLKNKHFSKQYMSLDIYKKAIDDIEQFGSKVKALIFAGHGEPLMHKNIAEMVSYAKKNNIAERIEIVTNGALLTKTLSDQLIEAGLDRLRISIQGINSKIYSNVIGKKFDYEELVKRITYFYKNKTDTEVYCKIIDIALQANGDKDIFMNTFSPISDEAAVEYAIPFVNEIDLSKQKNNFENSKQGNPVINAQVCSMPFYMLVVAPNGDVLPCCSTDIPIVYGNVKNQSLLEIWNSKIRMDFCKVQLLKERYRYKSCAECSVPKYGLQSGDYLDSHASDLISYYK